MPGHTLNKKPIQSVRTHAHTHLTVSVLQNEGDGLCFGEPLAARVREAGSGEVLFVQAVQKERL